MRILFVHNGSDLYGASRCMLRLASHLARDGHAVKAVLPYDGPLRNELEGKGIAVVLQNNLAVIVRQDFRTLSGILRFALRVPLSVGVLWATVRRFKPDVIHTNTAVIVSPGIVSKLTRVAHVWHMREFFSEFPSFWRKYQWFICAFSDVIVCISGPVAAQFHKSIQKKKSVVIHDGIPREEFARPDEQRVDDFQRKYGLNGHLAIGIVGRIKFRRKGQEVFVKAAALLKDKYPNAKFLCIGSPFPGNEEHLRMLMDLVDRSGLGDQFIYTGDVDDIQAAYEALDVSVLASVLPEPFGNVTVEAMAMGKPVIGTRIGGTIELIEDGVTGFLVEPNNPQELASAIERLLTDKELRLQFGENGRKRYLALFEFERFYQKMLGVYAKLLRGPSNA